MVISVATGATQKLPPKLSKLSKHIDVTIHWKALEEHMLIYVGENIHFLKIPTVLKGLWYLHH
jgi:hypothetical protein